MSGGTPGEVHNTRPEEAHNTPRRRSALSLRNSRGYWAARRNEAIEATEKWRKWKEELDWWDPDPPEKSISTLESLLLPLREEEDPLPVYLLIDEG